MVPVMESTSIRNKLHEYIDIADERKLEAIYVILESDIEQAEQYTTADITLLHERRTNYLTGSSKSRSASTSLAQARANRK